jgi:single-stranded-DNA-specific exonuclease
MSITYAGAKYRWTVAPVDEAAVRAIADGCSIEYAIARSLYVRGYTTAQEAQAYLVMGAEWIADPLRLKGAEKAADRIMEAIRNNEKILIFGDYDVDGITSTAIMLSCLLPLGASINYFLPNRVRDGYGLSSKIVKKAAESKYQLIVTVDNGISAHQAVTDAKALGLSVIITDHHQVHGEVPCADIIVNPHQPGCEYPYKDFAGVGVIFKIMALLYSRLGKEMPAKAYELLMLGTVADVVPLRHENRYWVQQGLRHINTQRSFAVQVLAANGNVAEKTHLNSRDIGFAIAPQLNALGRLDDPRDGVSFLISSDMGQVMQVGVTLKSINEERKRVDRAIYDEIVAAIEAGQIDIKTEYVIMAASHSWPAGVIGLVAGKLMQQYGRPVILFHLTKDGLAKGSCRSIPAFNMFDALASCEELLLSFGGHACAAGLSLRAADVSELKRRMEALVSAQLSMDDLVLSLSVDAPVTLRDLTYQFMGQVQRMEPFGNANPEPVFVVEGVTLVQEPRLLKEKHVRCMVFSEGILKSLLFFNRPELYQPLCRQGDKPFTVAVHITSNEWQGKTSIELQGVDISFSGEQSV